VKSRDQARRERHWALTERPRLLLDLADEIAKELEAMRDEAENPAQRRQRLRAVK
jgi:DNA-binding transcriptional LysR family regulator